MTSSRPKVSIGLPVYNAEKYLEGALESILKQTFTDFELIISDNASTDNTGTICRTYKEKDSRIHYYQNKINLGMAPNFNKVFQLAKGEYFKWAAYDDLLEPEFLMECVKVLDNNADVVICYPRAKIIDEDGVFMVDYDPGPDTSFSQPQVRFRNLILHPEYAIQQMGLIRSVVLQQSVLHGSYSSSDEILLAELGLLGRYYEIPDRLFIYRRSNQQLAYRLDERSRVPFFDTALRGKIVLQNWLYFLSCIKIIHRHRLSWNVRLDCYITMVRWLLVPAHFKALGKDILLAVGQYLRRSKNLVFRQA